MNFTIYSFVYILIRFVYILSFDLGCRCRRPANGIQWPRRAICFLGPKRRNDDDDIHIILYNLKSEFSQISAKVQFNMFDVFMCANSSSNLDSTIGQVAAEISKQ